MDRVYRQESTGRLNYSGATRLDATGEADYWRGVVNTAAAQHKTTFNAVLVELIRAHGGSADMTLDRVQTAAAVAGRADSDDAFRAKLAGKTAVDDSSTVVADDSSDDAFRAALERRPGAQ